MAEIEKLDGESLDIVEQNIEQLKALFPSVFSEGKIQFNKLEELLGNYVVEDEDHYNFTWHGKRKAGRLAQTPSTGTLRPCKEESMDWDTTENIFIEGDNLEVLKLLQKSYHRQVKMIYIDPPYNTGNDFVYEDDFKDGVKHYLELTGQVDGDGKKVGTNSSAAGRYHTNWLNMMYPRLRLARNLLRDDGAIFISIDDNEQTNARKLCDNIFGEENFIAQFIWAAGRKNDSKHVSVSHEYIIVYCKNKEFLKKENIIWRTRKSGLDDIYKAYKKIKSKYDTDYLAMTEALKKWYKDLPDSEPAKRHKHYSHVDARGIYFPDNISWPGGGGPKYEVLHPITNKPCKIPSRGWMFGSKEKMDEVIADDRVHFGLDETSVPCIKSHLIDREEEVPYSVFYQDGRASTKRLRSLMGDDVFDHPKDEIVLADLIEASTENGDIICDFFAGSATTAHAMFIANSKQKISRRFLIAQLPEIIDSSNETGKKKKLLQKAEKFLDFLGKPKTVAEISKERIRRAAKKIKDENPDYEGDLGFKVFKLDSSNIKRWDADFDTLEQDLVDAADYLVEGRSDEDVLYELCLKLGLDLSVKIEEETVAGEKLFVLGRGYLVVCLSNNVTMNVVNGIGDLKDKLAPEDGMRVVFKDDGFKDDVIKTNALQTLKRFGITDIKSL